MMQKIFCCKLLCFGSTPKIHNVFLNIQITVFKTKIHFSFNKQYRTFLLLSNFCVFLCNKKSNGSVHENVKLLLLVVNKKTKNYEITLSLVFKKKYIYYIVLYSTIKQNIRENTKYIPLYNVLNCLQCCSTFI